MTDEFRDRMLTLYTRQFGKVAESLVKLLKNYSESDTLEFDLYDSATNERIEVKSSRVYKKRQLKITTDNLYDIIINSSNRNRLLSQSQVEADIGKAFFDCNMQQVKTTCFDKLYYLLLFYDVIEFSR